jgi:type III secretory pathway component EscT
MLAFILASISAWLASIFAWWISNQEFRHLFHFCNMTIQLLTAASNPTTFDTSCHIVCVWPQMGFGLVNRFTDQLQVITTNKYNTINISTLYSSLEHSLVFSVCY